MPDKKNALYQVLVTTAVIQTIVFGFVSAVLAYQLSSMFDEANRVEQLARKAFLRIEAHLELMHTTKGDPRDIRPLGATQ